LQAAVGLDMTRRSQAEEFLGKRLHVKTAPEEQQEHVALCLARCGITDPTVARRTAGSLVQAMSKLTNQANLQDLTQGLSWVAARLEPKEGALACGQAATTHLQAISRTTDPRALPSLLQGLSAMAARMEPKEVGQAAATLIQTMSQTTDAQVLQALSQSVSSL